MATLKDVAKEAGLTVTTVSRVLNNRGYISDDARKRVADAMEKLNYRPNELARSLHNKTTNTIGLIVPHIKHPYFSEMISHIEAAAYSRGYRILLCNSQSKDERVKQYIDICTSNRVAGLILCSGKVAVESFKGLDIPIITMERYLDTGTASVECDNEEGGRLAAYRLIENGCKNLLLIGKTDSVEMPADKRGIGFRNVCEDQNISYIEVDPDEALYNDMTYNELIESILIEYPKIDGVFASSDVIGAQTLQVCSKMGINVPEDLKIVGFDDVLLASLTTPQLTTIRQPIKEMASVAVDLLIKASNEDLVAKQTVLPVCLVERGTA